MKIYLSMAAFVLLWNSGFIGAEYGLASAGTFTLLFWRYLFLTLGLSPLLLRRTRKQQAGRRIVTHTMIVGVLSHGVWLSCAVLSIQLGVPAGIVALIVALQPLFTGVLASRWLGESPSNLQWLGLFLGMAGVAVTVVARMTGYGVAPLVGYLLPLGAVIAMTLASVMQRKLHLSAESAPMPIGLMLFYQSLATTMALLIPAVALENMATEWDGRLVLALLWLIIAVSFGAYLLMWKLIEWTDATRVAGLFYLSPPVTALMGWFAFRDGLLLTDFAGLALAGLGAWLAQRASRTSSSG